jgi:stage II sporulation protein D
VRIYTDKTFKSVQIVVFSGSYEMIDSSGTTRKDWNKNDTITIKPINDELVVFSSVDTVFMGKFIRLQSNGFLNIFQILQPDPKRLYDDNLLISLRDDGTIWLINEVELEHYVAGVVQAEAGIAKNGEFFKVQAVAVRTFTLRNIEKHAAEGYQLCDQTHCQVYKGRCGNTDIMLATSKTAGEIMIDTSGQPIMAVFHSNSGGQTANSEDVWGKAVYYLRSVNDPYSIGQNSYSWQKSLSRTEWLEYLRKNFEFPINNPIEAKRVTNFSQTSRKAYLVDNISLRRVREDFKLRSTFFNISEQGDQVVFSGKGFGHGVGMSQEGAMNMARQGFIYIDILKFYYLGIEITTIDQISPTE